MKISQKTNDFPAHKFRKEDHFCHQYTVINLTKSGQLMGDYKPINTKNSIILRIYSTGARCYACLWINEKEHHLSGGAYAGGYGYHKASAAAQGAISAAGIELDKNIAGVGDDAVQEALLAIALHINPDDKFLICEAYA